MLFYCTVWIRDISNLQQLIKPYKVGWNIKVIKNKDDFNRSMIKILSITFK